MPAAGSLQDFHKWRERHHNYYGNFSRPNKPAALSRNNAPTPRTNCSSSVCQPGPKRRPVFTKFQPRSSENGHSPLVSSGGSIGRPQGSLKNGAHFSGFLSPAWVMTTPNKVIISVKLRIPLVLHFIRTLSLLLLIVPLVNVVYTKPASQLYKKPQQKSCWKYRSTYTFCWSRGDASAPPRP